MTDRRCGLLPDYFGGHLLQYTYTYVRRRTRTSRGHWDAVSALGRRLLRFHLERSAAETLCTPGAVSEEFSLPGFFYRSPSQVSGTLVKRAWIAKRFRYVLGGKWYAVYACSSYVLTWKATRHRSFTPTVVTSLSFAKLVTWMNVTLLPGLCIKIVIDYSSTSVQFKYLRMFTNVCTLSNCNHLLLSMWINKETWWWRCHNINIAKVI